MDKIIALILILSAFRTLTDNRIENQSDQIVIKWKIKLMQDDFSPGYISLFTNRVNSLKEDPNKYFWITIKRGYLSKANSRFDIAFLGYRTLKIKNIPLDKDTVDLGLIPLFLETTDLVALDYIHRPWYSLHKLKERKYYKEYKLHETDYKLKREQMNQQILNYNYYFNNRYYKIEPETDLLDLK